VSLKTLERDQVIPAAIALFAGAALFFAVATIPAMLFGDDSPLLVPIDVAAYGVAGVVFGLIWPNAGWRLGLWLFAVWPLMLLFSMFLAGEVLLEGSVSWVGVLRDLAGALLVLAASCFGAEAGAVIRRLGKANTAGA
jgi:hypothetical protein